MQEKTAIQKEFENIYLDRIHREGAIDLLNWLETETDFFTAPASTRFHGAVPGGLCEHSLNVYHWLVKLAGPVKEETGIEYSEETLAISALLHDLCKANFYKVSTRNQKNEVTGQWEKVPFYTCEDQQPLGDHGDKSVILIMRKMQLTDDEIYAIRWHMGGFDNAVRGGSFAYNSAMDKCPLVAMIHAADSFASCMSEVRGEVRL